MINSLKLLGLVTLLFLGAWGWGTAALGVLRRAGWDTVREEIGPPIQMLLGVGLFLAFGGVLVAFDAARLGPLLAWQVIGVGFLLARLVRGKCTVMLPSFANSVAIAVVGLFLTVLALGVAIGTPYNPKDDDPAYIYLAQRLASTGGLIDPFNLRRLTEYGGSTLYQSMFLRVTGTSSLHGFEFVFGSLLLILIAVGTTRRRWLAAGTLLVGVGVILGNDIGLVANISPNFSIAAFSLGLLYILRRIRKSSERDEPLVYVVIGILLSGILALRFSFLVSVGITVVLVVVALRRRRAVKPLLVIGVTMVVCSAGWAIALFRSSRTPMFPLIGGNYNKSWPTGQNPSEFAHGYGTFAHFAWEVFTGDNLGWVAVAAALIGLSFLVLSHWESKEMLVLFSAGVGCLLQFAAFTYSFSGSTTFEVVRLIAPSTLACGLFALGLVWPQHDAEGGAPLELLATSGFALRVAHYVSREAKRAVAPARVAVATMFLLLLGVAVLTFGWSIGGFVQSAKTDLTVGLGGSRYSSFAANVYLYVLTHPGLPFEPEYRQMNSMIPRDAKVLAAVDYPALLSFTKYRFVTLDIVGAVSPSPGMPYFKGPLAKVDYLRSLGYDYVVAEAPSDQGLYDIQNWSYDSHGGIYAYRHWAPYFIDWQNTVTFLEHSHEFTVRHTGSLVLIRID